LSGILVQRGVDASFSAYVPVEVQTRSERKVLWVATGGDPVEFSIPMKSPPLKVALLSDDCLMTTAK
jgi:hypothetical protein